MSDDTECYGLTDIESFLAELRGATAMLGHLATSDDDVAEDELRLVQDSLAATHRKLEAAWRQAWEDRKAEAEAHRAALAKAEAEAKDTAPGSVRDLKAAQGMLWLILAGHKVGLEQCNEMHDRITAELVARGVDVPAAAD